jgi:hypothetical protein
MKQIERQKSIGWFKLAEFVERGEKERALGIYKLLALSIDDLAFAYQLEGDILLAFEDTLASSKYLQAAEHYIKQNNIMAAIGTLHHLIILAPEQTHAWQMLNDLYLNHYLTKSTTHLRNLINHKQITSAQSYIEKLITKCQQEQKTPELDIIVDEIQKISPALHQFTLQALKK